MYRIVSRGLTLCFVSILLGGSAEMALAAERVALVIGNSNYEHTEALPNPHNDAADISAALRKLGFTVTEGTNLDKASMDKTIREFTESLPGAHVALFFYAGHGLQYEGQNYLVPVDAKLASRGALGFETVRLDLIQNAMESETSTNIIMLDACRNNPLGRNLAKSLGTRGGVGQGLALVESGEGTLISFSTQPGNVALDGSGRNSPYASALLAHINTPGMDLSGILISMRNDVMRATERRQIPWEHSALTAPFYFVAPPKSASISSAAQLEIAFWDSVKDSTTPKMLQAYLDKFPNGTFVPLAVARIEQLKQMDAALSPKHTALPASLTEGQQKPLVNTETLAGSKATASLPTEVKPEPGKNTAKEPAPVPVTVKPEPNKTNAQGAVTTETSAQQKQSKRQELAQKKLLVEKQRREKKLLAKQLRDQQHAKLKAEKLQSEKKEQGKREAEKIQNEKKAQEKRHAEKLQNEKKAQEQRRVEKLEQEKKKLAKLEDEKQEQERQHAEKLHREKQAEHEAATKIASCGSGQVSDGNGNCVAPQDTAVKEGSAPRTGHWESSWTGSGTGR